MKRLTTHTLPLLELALMVASIITATVMPNDISKDIKNGVLQASTGGGGNQKTCVNVAGSKNCHYTDNSITSSGVRSSIPNNGSSNLTPHVNSSQSPS